MKTLFSMAAIREVMIWIGGIPTLISITLFSIMGFVTARNKAFCFKDLKSLKDDNAIFNKKEDDLRNKIRNAPRGVQFLYRKWIGEIVYHDLMNGR